MFTENASDIYIGYYTSVTYETKACTLKRTKTYYLRVDNTNEGYNIIRAYRLNDQYWHFPIDPFFLS